MRDRDQADVAAVEGGWVLRFRDDGGAASAMSTQALTVVRDPTHHWAPTTAKPRWEALGGSVNAAYNQRTRRMAVPGGAVYLSTLATRSRHLTLSLVFGPAADGLTSQPALAGNEQPLADQSAEGRDAGAA